MTIQYQAKKATQSQFPLVHGDQVIQPATMSWVMENCFHEAQRGRMKTASLHVNRFVLLMQRGRWLDGSQISVARLLDGTHFLVNGYHRAAALIAYGKPLVFNVQIVDCDDMNDVDALFSLYDRSIGTRTRPYEQAANALHASERIGVSKQTAKALYGAVLLIKNNMRPILQGDRESLLPFEAMEDRIDACLDWKAEAEAMDEILRPAASQLKRKLMTGPVFAVALITMKYQPSRAREFWSLVAGNDGLRRGTPEHSLVQRLLTERMESHSEEPFIIPALAWNAFYAGRQLGMIKAGAACGLRIAGTPIGKGQA